MLRTWHTYSLERVCLYDLPKSIVSDSDVRFTLASFLKKMKIALKFSTAYHSQTDDQTKVVNCNLGNLLRCLVGEQMTT